MSEHVFADIPNIKIPRSVFRRPFNLKTTVDTDYLYPIYCDEALPADTVKMTCKFFGRLATPVVPIMDNLYLDLFFFAVPNRLIDDNWRKFMGERPFGDSTTVYSVPKLNTGSNGVSVGSLSDYIGIPIGVPYLDFCPYWHRSYSLIWNEWFRDENLCIPAPVAGKHYDGTVRAEALSDYYLRKRGKRHDYFTSCLPWPQKGSPVGIGLGGSALVHGDGHALVLQDYDTNSAFNLVRSQMVTSTQGGTLNNHALVGITTGGYASLANTDVGFPTGTPSQGIALGVRRTGSSGLYADLSTASAVTINNLRYAVALQSLLETDARAGTRYIEILRAHFSVVSPDARMQRPEYLGGTSVPVHIVTVAQTSSTDSTSPQGNTAAFGTVNAECSFSKSFTEHCTILGLCNIRADLSYQQGLPRMFSRSTRYDFYWPELANLGEQAVLNKEIYAQGDAQEDNAVFGYQERWSEYRYHPNMITGLLRSTAPLSLDVWHLAQKFDSLPTLSQTFIEESVPIARCIATPNQPAFILDGYFDSVWARPMPLYSVPGLGRRF